MCFQPMFGEQEMPTRGGNVIKLRISQKRVRYYPVPGSFFDGISTIFLKSTKKCLTKQLFYAAKS